MMQHSYAAGVSLSHPFPGNHYHHLYLDRGGGARAAQLQSGGSGK